MTGVLAATRLASREEGIIEKLIDRGVYLNTSEFIREAVREKLERLGEMRIIVAKPVSKSIAKKQLLSYFKEHPGSYVSEAADALGIDVASAFEAASELVKDKKVG